MEKKACGLTCLPHGVPHAKVIPQMRFRELQEP